MVQVQLRVTKIDELQLLTCLKHQVWGSQRARFKDWQVGDHLAFIVDKAVAGLAQVSGKPYQSKEIVWDDRLYPYRLPLRFVHVIAREHRPPILGPLRDALTSAWGMRYGLGIIHQWVLSGDNAQAVFSSICSKPNSLSEIQANLEAQLEEAKAEREARKKKKRNVKVLSPAEEPKPIEVPPIEVPALLVEEHAHSRYQSPLVQLGKVTGCFVWIAANDRGKLYDGKPLGEGCLKSLPRMGLSGEAAERISLIDIIWIQKNAPVCAFEVEISSQVFSGLLRMSDLLAVVPALNVKLYVVAARDRQGKVMKELGRPTFQKIGLSEYCRFLPSEELEALARRVQGLGGHVQPSVLDTIAVELELDLPEVAM
jgi:hypothetical protein